MPIARRSHRTFLQDISTSSAHVYLHPARNCYLSLYISRKTKTVRLAARMNGTGLKVAQITRRKAAGILWLMWLIARDSKGQRVSLYSLFADGVSRGVVDGEVIRDGITPAAFASIRSAEDRELEKLAH